MNLEIKQQIEDISSTVQSLYGGLKDELKQKFDGLQRQVDAVEVKLGAPAYSSVPGIEWKGPGGKVTQEHVDLLRKSGRIRIDIGNLWEGWNLKTLVDSTALGSSTPGHSRSAADSGHRAAIAASAHDEGCVDGAADHQFSRGVHPRNHGACGVTAGRG